MNMVMNLVLALQIIAALVMIGLVLIQHGKGADMGASFGSGASGSLFGATGSANFLSRSTAVCAAVFFICTLSLAYTSNDRPRATTGSILDRPAGSASAPLPAASGAAQIPGAVPTSPAGAGASAPAAATTVAPAAPVVPAAPSTSGAGAIPQK
jgi:preprotein translocase subunit SecG